MNNTKKVIACLYAGIVAANAMDENVIERENPDSNNKSIINTNVKTTEHNNNIDPEEQHFGTFFEYINGIDKQKHAPSTTIATIKNDNGIDQEESKVKEVDNKIDSEKVVTNTNKGQSKENPKTKKHRKKQNKLKSECKTDQPIDYSKYIEIEGKPVGNFYIIRKLKINNEGLEKVCAKKMGEPIVTEYNIFGKTKIGDNEYRQTFIASKSISSVESNYLKLKLNFLQEDGMNVIFPKDCSGLFSKSSALLEVNFSSAEFSKNGEATSAKYMFADCSNLYNVDFGSFDTSKITDMWGMFALCRNLTDLRINHFNTEKVTNMEGMFHYCSSLENLDISKFNTANVTNMRGMFYGCPQLKNLDVNNFDTKNVTNMEYMFRDCSSLESLNISNFNTANVTNMRGMFCGCPQLKNLDVSNFDTKNVTNMYYMFYDCSSLESLNISNFNTANVTNMRCMFYKCSSLTSLNIPNFNTENVTSMDAMFYKCSSLTSLNISNFNTEKVTNMAGMFGGCSQLEELDIRNFNTKAIKIENMRTVFRNCVRPKTLRAQTLETFYANNDIEAVLKTI